MKLIQGDCLEEMKKLEDNSIDSIIKDPPYGLKFMGKKWDYQIPGVEVWQEVLRVLKPGGHALIACGTRTQHRMAVNIEDAGFEIRDVVSYLYGSGFPKSHNIFKALKKKCTCGIMVEYENGTYKRKTSTQKTEPHLRSMQETNLPQTITNKKTEGEVLQSGLSEQSTSTKEKTSRGIQLSKGEGQSSLEGWSAKEKNPRELSGSNVPEVSKEISTNGEKRRLYNATQASNGSTPEQATNKNGSSPSQRPQSEQQPDTEPCAICEQFLAQEARSWEGFGTALKPAYEPIICARKPNEGTYANNALKHGVSGLNIDGGRVKTTDKPRIGNTDKSDSVGYGADNWQKSGTTPETGRFPANIILDEEAGKMLDEQSGESKSAGNYKNKDTAKEGGNGMFAGGEVQNNYANETGGASRFFYCAKASKAERNAGCEDLEEKDKAGKDFRPNHTEKAEQGEDGNAFGRWGKIKNNHPTVKPLKLMEYLCTLTKTPTGGTVLDMFAGSGSTGVACQNTGRDFILIEMTPEYIPIIEARISEAKKDLESKLL